MSNLNIWLACRLLFSRKNIGYISWSGLISVLGVAVGCFALLVSVAVLNGFEEEIQKRIIGFDTDLRIDGRSLDKNEKIVLEDILNRSEDIEAFSFFLEKKGIVFSDEAWSLTRIKAVEDIHMSSVYFVGNVNSVEYESELPIVHLGLGVAERLGVVEGDSIRLLSPVDNQLFLGFPATVKVIVGSIFETRILDFDESYCFVPLELGQHLFKKWDTFHGADLRLSNKILPSEVKAKLEQHLPEGLRISKWEDLHQTLFSAMRMEKLGSIVVLSLIVLVASFNIASTLIMLVMEKVKEIGILRAMGATRNRIRSIVDFQGLIVGGVGMCLGLFGGLLFILVQKQWGIIKLPKGIYFVDSLPVLLSWLDVAVILAVGVFLIMSSIFYPAKIAGKLLPTAAIQFEK